MRCCTAVVSAKITTARDAFSHLHFGLVAGLVLIALAMKSALGYSAKYGSVTTSLDMRPCQLGLACVVPC